mgnify:CR=1 FL=1
MALGALDNKIESPKLGGGGGSLKAINPMESMVSTFKDMRDGILDLMVGIDSLVSATKDGFSKLNSHLAYRFETIVAAIQMTPAPTAAESVAAADTDTGDDEAPAPEKRGMLQSLRDSVGEDEIGKLKKALFLGIVASLFIFSEQIKPIVAKFLKGLKKVVEVIGPKGALFLAILGISRLAFPKTFALVLKGAGLAIKLVAAGFSSLFSFITTTLIPFVIAFAVPIAIITAVVAGVIAAIYAIKKGIEAFKESLDQGDSMFTAIVKGITTALVTLATLPATLFTKLVGFVAGLLGFDNIKDKLMNIDFVGAVTDSLFNMFTKAKDFVMSIFDIDFAGMFGKVLDIGKMIIGRIKAIGAAGFAAVKAAFPGGESPMEAFKRVYQERTAGSDGGGDAEPEVDEDPDIAAIKKASMGGPGAVDAFLDEKLGLDDGKSNEKIANEPTDVEKLTDATAEKTHEEGDKRSTSKRDEYDGLVSQGFTKSDARKILMFDTNKSKGFPAYEEASMKALGYNFQSEFMTPAEKLAWMKSKMIVDDEGNLFKPTSKDGDYKQLSKSEMSMRAAAAEGRKDLKDAVEENGRAKDDAAGSGKSGNVVVNNNTTNSNSTNNTTNHPLSADHSDPTANTLKQLSAVF